MTARTQTRRRPAAELEAAPAAITIDGPNDWLAAIPGHRRRFPDTRWGRHKRRQVSRARTYLDQRQHGGNTDTGTVARRAAVILNAMPGAPELERMLGIRLAIHLEGEDVKCRTCRRTWKCLPEDPYYDAAGVTGGLCGACMLAETRRDVAVPAIEPTAVTGPPRASGDPETETAGTVAELAERADAIIAGFTTGQDGAA